MSKQKYSVIGYYTDTGRRFVKIIAASSTEEAEVLALREYSQHNLVIVATAYGDVTVYSEARIRTMDDISQFGAAPVCRDGGKHIPNFQTLSHLSGTEGELNVFCLKCGRPGSIIISADNINW